MGRGPPNAPALRAACAGSAGRYRARSASQTRHWSKPAQRSRRLAARVPRSSSGSQYPRGRRRQTRPDFSQPDAVPHPWLVPGSAGTGSGSSIRSCSARSRQASILHAARARHASFLSESLDTRSRLRKRLNAYLLRTLAPCRTRYKVTAEVLRLPRPRDKCLAGTFQPRRLRKVGERERRIVLPASRHESERDKDGLGFPGKEMRCRMEDRDLPQRLATGSSRSSCTSRD
jgi:hypothetical protein